MNINEITMGMTPQEKEPISSIRKNDIRKKLRNWMLKKQE